MKKTRIEPTPGQTRIELNKDDWMKAIREWLLSHESIKVPEEASISAIDKPGDETKIVIYYDDEAREKVI